MPSSRSLPAASVGPTSGPTAARTRARRASGSATRTAAPSRSAGASRISPGKRIGREYVGIVQEVGAEVRTVKPGDFVVTPFVASDGTCPNCLAGYQSVCQNIVGIGSKDADGGQGEYAKVPYADGTLVATPEVPDDSLVPSLLTLSDVMG